MSAGVRLRLSCVGSFPYLIVLDWLVLMPFFYPLVLLLMLCSPLHASAQASSGCCYYNARKIDCWTKTSAHGFTINWADGVSQTYQLISQDRYGTQRVYRDPLGGIWDYRLLARGDWVLENPANGNSIHSPLRCGLD